MPDILIRGLSAQTIRRLKARAKRNGRSLQGEVRTIIEIDARPSVTELLAGARECRKKLGRRFEDSVTMIREDRER
jgi:plasmid stability protein